MNTCPKLIVVVAALATLPWTYTPLARAEGYPSRTIKIIVPQAPGGLVDVLPRILAQRITETTKQAVVVENRIGGNGVLAGAEVAKAPADGYTLLSTFHALNAMLPHMTQLTFDPNKDLIPVAHILTVPTVLVVHPSVPAHSVKELVAYAKASPGKLSFASQGIGSAGQVAGEMFKQRTGADFAHVPYRGAAPAAQALLGGQVTMMFDAVALAAEPVKAGKLRALGVASARRVSALPDVPTMAEGGVPMEMSAWFGLMAPAGTPPSVVAWLNQKTNEVFSEPEVRERYISRGAEFPLGTPESFGKHIAAEFRKWGPVIREANISID